MSDFFAAAAGIEHPPRVITSQMGVSDIGYNGLSRRFWLLKLLQRGTALPGWASPHLVATWQCGHARMVVAGIAT